VPGSQGELAMAIIFTLYFRFFILFPAWLIAIVSHVINHQSF
jgi:hypothetical protein